MRNLVFKKGCIALIPQAYAEEYISRLDDAQAHDMTVRVLHKSYVRALRSVMNIVKCVLCLTVPLVTQSTVTKLSCYTVHYLSFSQVHKLTSVLAISGDINQI